MILTKIIVCKTLSQVSGVATSHVTTRNHAKLTNHHSHGDPAHGHGSHARSLTNNHGQSTHSHATTDRPGKATTSHHAQPTTTTHDHGRSAAPKATATIHHVTPSSSFSHETQKNHHVKLPEEKHVKMPDEKPKMLQKEEAAPTSNLQIQLGNQLNTYVQTLGEKAQDLTAKLGAQAQDLSMKLGAQAQDFGQKFVSQAQNFTTKMQNEDYRNNLINDANNKVNNLFERAGDFFMQVFPSRQDHVSLPGVPDFVADLDPPPPISTSGYFGPADYTKFGLTSTSSPAAALNATGRPVSPGGVVDSGPISSLQQKEKTVDGKGHSSFDFTPQLQSNENVDFAGNPTAERIQADLGLPPQDPTDLTKQGSYYNDPSVNDKRLSSGKDANADDNSNENNGNSIDYGGLLASIVNSVGGGASEPDKSKRALIYHGNETVALHEVHGGADGFHDEQCMYDNDPASFWLSDFNLYLERLNSPLRGNYPTFGQSIGDIAKQQMINNQKGMSWVHERNKLKEGDRKLLENLSPRIILRFTQKVRIVGAVLKVPWMATENPHIDGNVGRYDKDESFLGMESWNQIVEVPSTEDQLENTNIAGLSARRNGVCMYLDGVEITCNKTSLAIAHQKKQSFHSAENELMFLAGAHVKTPEDEDNLPKKDKPKSLVGATLEFVWPIASVAAISDVKVVYDEVPGQLSKSDHGYMHPMDGQRSGYGVHITNLGRAEIRKIDPNGEIVNPDTDMTTDHSGIRTSNKLGLFGGGEPVLLHNKDQWGRNYVDEFGRPLPSTSVGLPTRSLDWYMTGKAKNNERNGKVQSEEGLTEMGIDLQSEEGRQLALQHGLTQRVGFDGKMEWIDKEGKRVESIEDLTGKKKDSFGLTETRGLLALLLLGGIFYFLSKKSAASPGPARHGTTLSTRRSRA